MKPRAAFTLMELLVCLGIVGLLTAILMPALFKSRQQGTKATCQSNLRQAYHALRQYIDDNDGSWPDEEAWRNEAFTTVKFPGCPQVGPAARDDRLSKPLTGSGYAINTALHITADRHFIGIPDRDIPFPAVTVAVCEESVEHYMTWGPNPYEHTGMDIPPDEEKGWLRHNGGANYLFVDGHVKWYTPDAVGYNFMGSNKGDKPTFAL